METQSTHLRKVLSDSEAIRTARKAALVIHREGSPLPIEDLEQTACLEAIRVVRTSAHTATARRPGLLYRSCREACIRAIDREHSRQSSECELSEAAERQARAITRAHSWAYVRREPIPDPHHVTCYVWSFKVRGSVPEYLKRAIARLCSAQREAAELVYLRDLTQRQAARRLGISPAAIHQRLALAAKKIKVFLREP